MAFVSPLLTASGFISVLILFGGVGAPSIMLAATLLVGIFAVGFTAMGRFMPNPGAFYSYVTAGLGRVAGLGAAFIAIATYVLLILGAYTFFGISATSFVSEKLGGPNIQWYWYAFAIWLVVSAFGYLHIEFSAKVLLVCMALEVLVIVIFDIAVFANTPQSGFSAAPFTWGEFTGGSLGIGLLFAILLFNGFEATAVFREEVRNPRRTIARATMLVVVFIGGFYAITSYAMVTFYGVNNATIRAEENPVTMFSSALESSTGRIMLDVAAVLLLTSIFAALLSIHSILSRYFYSLGVDRVLPRALASVHPRFGSPYRGSLVAAGVVFVVEAVFVAGGADPSTLYGQQGGTGGYGYLILFSLTSVAVLAYFFRRRREQLTSSWAAFVAPALATAGMGTLLAIAAVNFTTLAGGSGVLALVLQGLIWGTGFSGVGLALYLRAHHPDRYARIGRQMAEAPVMTNTNDKKR